MDGGNGLNILYVDTLDAMRIPWLELRPEGSPFHGMMPGAQAYPLGQIDLPIMFGNRANFCSKLKMLGPNGIIIVGSAFSHAFTCDRKHFELATTGINSSKLP
ncbi:uncharacterized protein [Miscanthus floridulus]|uniref:uncharacterized protein n=1 Tax=Miscanthus floridulus TaxID=154761 RepID=UPI00345A94A8